MLVALGFGSIDWHGSTAKKSKTGPFSSGFGGGLVQRFEPTCDELELYNFGGSPGRRTETECTGMHRNARLNFGLNGATDKRTRSFGKALQGSANLPRLET